MQDAAKRYLDAGLCVLPAMRAQKRPALRSWKQYQSRLPTEDEIDAWFANGHDGLCLLTGKPSGNLELLDFDQGGELFEPWSKKVEAAVPGLLDRLVVETSQSGGWHVVYRCEGAIGGNMKLAQRAGNDGRPVTLIETRGEGGLFLCAPTPGYELIQGDLANPPVLTEAQRETLLTAAWELNEYSAESGLSSPTSAYVGPVLPVGDQSRPGDDFNARGDVVAVLRKHGWRSCGERADGNEHWTRPGKPAGHTSATLKDGSFYVFSSNAAPFEHGQAYSPFAVYALLEHNGDYEAAARGLGQEGYGDANPMPVVSDVDLSGIVGATEQEGLDGEPPDIGPIPDALMQVPGFVGQVMEFCLEAARYPSVPLAFCGAMALQSFLCSRKVREEGGLRPNLYMLALASSGTGKAYPRKINSHILGKIGLAGAVGNQIASGQGLEDEMFVHRKMLYQTDEVDNMLRSLSSSKEAYHSMLLTMLLQLYTEADETHSMRTKAKGKGQANEIRGEIDQPGLVIFGTATPECFFEAMSPKLLTNGLFSRSIVVDVGQRGRKQRPRDVGELPGHLIEMAKWWKDYNPAPVHPTTGLKPDLDDEHPTPAIVPYTDGGFAVLDELGTQADDQYDVATAKGDRVRAILWTRVCENATRLALVYACSRDYENPCIDRETADWASRFTRHLADRMLFMASSHVAENPFHAECLKIMEKLRSAPDRQLAHSVLLKRMSVNARDFGGIIETLIQQGDIARNIAATKGRPQVIYRLRHEGAEGR